MNGRRIRPAVFAGLALGLVGLGTARAESLVSTLSDSDVQITSSFTGERIIVFGAVRDAPDERIPYDVAVVVQGPPQSVTVRRKERFLGVWLNRTSRSLDGVPSFYVMHLSGNFGREIVPARMAEYRLGVASLPFVEDAAQEKTAEIFARAVVGLKERHQLYVERRNAIEMLAPGIFRTTFFLPSDIPTGEYNVRVYLFRGATFLAGQTQALRIEKGGYSERIARAANDSPFAYGLACVAIAVLTGWLAGIVFRRP